MTFNDFKRAQYKHLEQMLNQRPLPLSISSEINRATIAMIHAIKDTVLTEGQEEKELSLALVQRDMWNEQVEDIRRHPAETEWLECDGCSRIKPESLMKHCGDAEDCFDLCDRCRRLDHDIPAFMDGHAVEMD